MAISNPVGLTNLLSQVGASNRDTASVTVEAGDLIVVTAGCSLNGAIGAFTITGLGATWVIHEEAEVTVTGLRTRGCVATALIPSGTSGVINVAVASGNPLRWNIAVEQIQADGALSVVQTEIAQPGTGTTHQVTLPGSPGAASLVFGGLIVHETTEDAVDNDPDFTEGYDSTSGGATIQSRVQTQYRNGGADAVVDWSGILTGANKIGIALEIAEEGGDPPDQEGAISEAASFDATFEALRARLAELDAVATVNLSLGTEVTTFWPDLAFEVDDVWLGEIAGASEDFFSAGAAFGDSWDGQVSELVEPVAGGGAVKRHPYSLTMSGF